jgi:hypothetical protein
LKLPPSSPMRIRRLSPKRGSARTGTGWDFARTACDPSMAA